MRFAVLSTLVACVVAVVTIRAQFPIFNESFEGEIWELQTPSLPGLLGGYIIGVTFADGNVYSGDFHLGAIVAHDASGQIIDLPDADWRLGEAANPNSPVYGMVPSELTTARVSVNGAPAIEAVMVSDSDSNRVFVFTGAGKHLFTMTVGDPGVVYPRPLLNGMALSQGATFFFNNQAGNPSLTLSGAFAVAWPEYFDLDTSAALVYRNQTFAFNPSSVAFEAAAMAELTGVEGGAGHMLSATGVAFDSADNLYVVDNWSERVHAYDADFQHLFTFGTEDPESPGATLEFNEPYGITFWPSAAGDRLMIADMINNRVVIYRPNLPEGRLDYLFALDGLGAIAGFPHSVAFDGNTGRIAVSDSFDPVQPKLWMFQTASLAVFDMQVTDEAGQPARSICAGSPFQVRFSVTVPENRAALQLASPQLTIDGVPVPATPSGPAFPVGSVADPLLPREVLTYTYSLTAPAAGPHVLNAHAIASSVSLDSQGQFIPIAPTDISGKLVDLSVSACPAGNAAPTVVVTPPATAGWIKVEPPAPAPLDSPFIVTATDDRGVSAIQYQLFFANQTAVKTVSFTGSNASEQVTVPLTNPGLTRIEFSALDNDGKWSATQSREIRIDNSVPGVCFTVPFGTSTVNNVNQRWWSSATVEIPIALKDAQDLNPHLAAPIPPEFNVDRLVFTAERANQVVTLLVRDHVGYEATVLSTSPLNPCSGPGGSLINIDRTGPSASSNTSDAAPFSSPISVTLSAQDVPSQLDGSSSGARGIEYRIGAGAWQRVEGVTLPLHFTVTTDLQFRAYDWAGNVGPTVARRYVINRLPLAGTPAPQVSLEGSSPTLQIVASDPDGDALQYSATGLPLGLTIGATGLISGSLGYDVAGNYSVTVTVFDGEQSTLITFPWRVDDVVPPNLPPVCSAIASPEEIWSPNHKAVYVSLSGISDPEGHAVTVRFTSILQDEPTDSVGQGNTMQDGGIEQNGAKAWIRAERAGTNKVPGDGRVYLIGYTATDVSGASCSGTVSVGVPHDRGKGPAILSPGRWNSLTGQQVSGASH